MVSQDGSREVRQDHRRFRVLALGPQAGGWRGADGAGVAGQVRPGVCLGKLGGIRIAAPRRLVLGTVSVTRMAEVARGVWVLVGSRSVTVAPPCQATVDDSTTKLAIPNRGGAILGRNQQPQAVCKSRQLSPGPGNKTPTSLPADDLSAARPLLGRLREKSRPRTDTASQRRVPPPLTRRGRHSQLVWRAGHFACGTSFRDGCDCE